MLTNDKLSECIIKVREERREKLNELATVILNKIDENFEKGHFVIYDDGHSLTTDITMKFISSEYRDDDSFYASYMDKYSPIIGNIIRDRRGFFSVEIRKLEEHALEDNPLIGTAVKYGIEIVPNIKEEEE